jgi:DNA-binding MarR family transcriptional regulator
MTITDEIAASCFASRLRAAARAITRHYDAALKPLDLKVTQLGVLVAVSIANGELTIVELAEKLCMDRSTLSRNFDPLARRGLVALGPEGRHRARHVTLTDAGAALLRDAYPLWKHAQNDVAAAVGDVHAPARTLDPIIARFA